MHRIIKTTVVLLIGFFYSNSYCQDDIDSLKNIGGTKVSFETPYIYEN